ncbi:DUF883 family protein [Martelella alba]|uniref:DUF883 family protein n=1 Tax=Martelella alba TaxID=2590451 RepID=A0A506UGE1_9HYPH|nr:DUF883 family protein [Martelella alba]TPW31087.1 DUF883 family protein [Martelella alba]
MVAAKATAKDTGETAKTTPEDIQLQIDQLRDDIAKLTKVIGDLGTEKAAEAKARAEEGVASAKARAERIRDEAYAATQDAYERAREEAISFEEEVEERIRMKPIQSVAIAASIGFLAALFTRR